MLRRATGISGRFSEGLLLRRSHPIEKVLDHARAQGLRSGDNPATYKGNFETLLPKSKRKQKHHAALPCEQMPGFIAALREVDTSNARLN